ncbi:MAG: phosphate uptake regulator PhoU [Candidatus Bathyarchaeia archaeon]
MENEEIRRIQITGKSTYILSLPKKWVSEMGLKAGSQIVILQEGKSLILIPKDLAKPSNASREATLKISANDMPEKIARAIIAAYLNGYNSIRIETLSDHMAPSQRNAVRELVKKKIVGTEIISDSPREMILKVLVGYPELSVESALRRMCLIASSMHEDSIKALIKLDKELAKNIIDLDDEVDRFGFYIIRQLKAAVQSDRILKDIGLSNPKDCLGYRLVVKFVERIADHAARIAENILSLSESPDKFILDKISEMSSFARSMFESSVESLFKRDYLLAEETISRAKKIALMEAEAIKAITEKAGKTISPALRMILESIRRTGEYSSDIAEIVLNLNVNQILAM